jgi:hypothetical protein
MGLNGQDIVQIVTIIAGFITTVSVPFIAYYIRRLEKNTNSMKDELVKSAEIIGKAAGNLQGRKELTEERVQTIDKKMNKEA